MTTIATHTAKERVKKMNGKRQIKYTTFRRSEKRAGERTGFRFFKFNLFVFIFTHRGFLHGETDTLECKRNKSSVCVQGRL